MKIKCKLHNIFPATMEYNEVFKELEDPVMNDCWINNYCWWLFNFMEWLWSWRWEYNRQEPKFVIHIPKEETDKLKTYTNGKFKLE